MARRLAGFVVASPTPLRDTDLLACHSVKHYAPHKPLCKQADIAVPLLEELAADIFMGGFTKKWPQAANHCCRIMDGTIYARYYDLPAYLEHEGVTRRGSGTPAATSSPPAYTRATFSNACSARAAEAHTGRGSLVASNGTSIEQSQILTNHNLAPLVETLGLQHQLAAIAPDLASQIFDWIIQRQNRSLGHARAQLQMLKNTAYAWRQAIYFLSLCNQPAQKTAVANLQQAVYQRSETFAQRFSPAVAGLKFILDGGRFDAKGNAPATPPPSASWAGSSAPTGCGKRKNRPRHSAPQCSRRSADGLRAVA